MASINNESLLKHSIFFLAKAPRRKERKEFFKAIVRNLYSSFASFAPLRLGEIKFRKLLILCTLWLIIFLFISCKTTPVIPDTFFEQTHFVPLNSGASVYVFADVRKAWPVIELLPYEELKNTQAVQMMERTDFAVIALFPQESGRRFQVAAWGNYPRSRANFGLTFNRNWRKERSQTGQDFWYSRSDKLSLALERNQVFAASSLTNEPFDPHISTPGVEIPQEFNEFRDGILSCWVEDPSLMLDRMLAGIPIQFPVQKLFINLHPAEEDMYTADIRFQLATSIHARGMGAILRLAGSYVSEESIASIFLANVPIQNDNNLDIKTNRLDKNEIALLFSIFSDI